MGARVARASYPTIRRFLLVAGLAVLAAVVAAMVARGVDTVEVLAAALYVGVYLGGLLAGVVGGATGGLAAAAAYAVLRADAIEALGPSRYGSLLLARLVGYVLFGLLIGAAWQWIGERLDKLDAFDDVDDETLLLNARGLVDAIDRESGRARRHGSTFAVVTLDLPLEVFDRMGRRRRRESLREFGRLVTQGSRELDSAGLYRANRTRRLALVLPETGAAGAEVVVGRLIERVGAGLLARDVPVPRNLRPMGYSFPDDAVEIGQIRRELIALGTAGDRAG